MDKNRFRFLFDKYLAGTLDETEQQEFDVMMVTMEEAEFSDLVDKSVSIQPNKDFDQDRVFKQIMGHTADVEYEKELLTIRPLYKGWKHWGKIAAVFLLMGLTGLMLYTLWSKKADQHDVLARSLVDDRKEIVLPENNVLITLADGKVLELTDLGKDMLHYKGLTLSRLDDGTVLMKQEGNADYFESNEKHRFTAPMGGTLRLQLPDASIVYLNSDSKVEIAASFGKKQRDVDLSGEAFFEVTHNKNIPFVVRAKNTAVTVLGTVFNMSAYQVDKTVATTLINGSVQVDALTNRMRIVPGQQAVVQSSNSIELNKNPDIGRITAWREGYFKFKDETIRDIMTELSKWYPIEDVEFKAGYTDRFTGSMKRSKKLSDVLANIEQVSDLRFDIQEGRVVIMK